MSWIDASWMVMIAACLTLSSIHLVIWNKQRGNWAHFAFSLAGISVAVVGVFELLLMHASSPEEFAFLLRWAHIPFAVLAPCLVAFVRLHLRAGRPWLGHLAWGLRALALIPNFTTGVSLNFIEVHALSPREAWGAAVYMAPVGTPNPWMIIGQLAGYALLAFLVDAAITEWRKGKGRSARSIRICSAMAFFCLSAAIASVMMVKGILHLPVAVLPWFTAVVIVMSYELGGDVIRAAQLARDLSRAESTLRQSEQRIEQAVLAAGIGFWEWDVADARMWLSPRANELIGLPDDEPFDRARYDRRIDPADRERVAADMAAVLASGGPFLIEHRIVLDDGRRRWILSRGQCELVAEPRTARVRGVLVDITERKLAEEQLRAVVESAPAGMIVVGTDHGIRFANRRAEQDFGWSREELAGMALDRLLPGLDAEATRRHRVDGREHFGLRRDGSEFPVEVVRSEIELAGKPALLVSATDVSERKRMERESAIQRDELAHLSRVALLAELSGSLAHELNQPLTSILSNSQAALRFMGHDPADLGEIRHCLDNIVESDKRAGEVIRRLRAMLRKEPAEFREIDLNEVVQDVLRIVRSDLLDRSVELHLRLESSLPASEGDRVQLQQVLLNLIVNGSDAMQERPHSRELTITTRAGERAGVELEVSDVGRGIPPEDLERIFSPFVTSKRDGMGLGLAVCKTIIESHRGRLWATNNEASGAALHFWLPAVGAAAALPT